MKDMNIVGSSLAIIALVVGAIVANVVWFWFVAVIAIVMLVVGLVTMYSHEKKLLAQIEQQKEELENICQKANANDGVVDEMIDVISKLKIGFLGFSVTKSSNNQEIENIRHLLNDSMIKLNSDIDQALKILTEYGNANFAYVVDTKGLSGKTGSLILGIRALGSSVSELIALISKTSEMLGSNISLLATASNSLSVASNQQAASLEETAAALEEITSTIISNTNNAQKMSQYAQELRTAVTVESKLSNQTVESMDNIHKEVQAINEAITVIDQIAFQTNILSLNAAVEAATAGEAGKGFAVVAGEVRNLASRSAEAAKEIKNLVESATKKAHHGKQIANEMIGGYDKLNATIASTIALITDVANASREQQAGIEQINDAVTELDQATQQNAAAATNINEMAKGIKELSLKLSQTTQKANFDQKALEQVCDMDLTMHLNALKLDHINFKNNNCSKLGTRSTWKVVGDHECRLGKWIDEQERNNMPFTKTSNWAHLKQVHHGVHNGMQEIINENASSSNNTTLGNQSHKLDEAISDVFWTIQQVKRDNCKN